MKASKRQHVYRALMQSHDNQSDQMPERGTRGPWHRAVSATVPPRYDVPSTSLEADSKWNVRQGTYVFTCVKECCLGYIQFGAICGNALIKNVHFS